MQVYLSFLLNKWSFVLYCFVTENYTWVTVYHKRFFKAVLEIALKTPSKWICEETLIVLISLFIFNAAS